MPYRYPPEFRRRVLDLTAADVEVSDQPIYNWRNQEMIDIGVEPGLTTVEAAELWAGKRRIT